MDVIERIKKDKSSTLVLAPNETSELLEIMHKLRRAEEQETIKQLKEKP